MMIMPSTTTMITMAMTITDKALKDLSAVLSAIAITAEAEGG